MLVEERRANNNLEIRKDTEHIRNDITWKVKPNVDKLTCRHVEITGPANDTKMVINAMNSKANGYMMDKEDSMSPTWDNVVEGMYNCYHLSRDTLKFNIGDKKYKLNKELIKSPTFHVRTRGLHMKESNVLTAAGEGIPALIWDLCSHSYHNASILSEKKCGPYFYFPKLETYEEAVLINDILTDMESYLSIKPNQTKCTVLIETLPAIFQSEEIIYGLKNYISGLNCGRWDYLYSLIKHKTATSTDVLPNRNLLTMDLPFLEHYVDKIVDDCHRRGCHAMGGMSADIPTKKDNIKEDNFDHVINDKLLEIARGCDGAWVAHPKLIEPVQTLFLEKLENNPNQLKYLKNDQKVKSSELLEIQPQLKAVNNYTEIELDNNIRVSLQYLTNWLLGVGAVNINNKMEDLATAEISLAQLKQWLTYEQPIKMQNYRYQPFTKQILKNKLDSITAMQITADRNKSDTIKNASNIIYDYIINNNNSHLSLEAYPYISNNETSFRGIQFPESVLEQLVTPYTKMSGPEITKLRGEFLTKFLYDDNNNKNNKFYQFLGTSTGISAVNVVAGGKGNVGPYSGGWQSNAMKNRLLELLPDTLHVTPEEVAVCARELNNHIIKADQIQHLEKVLAKSNEDNKDLKDLKDLNDKDDSKYVNYYDMALLADLEQGWAVPEKVRYSVKQCIENGINVIHIEDQGERKRCGHLGDKELATLDDYILILKAANLAAQEILGSEQSSAQWVRFVARTDALSAKRIHNSSNLYEPTNPEYGFIDWDKGTSKDGKYLYLKTGVNPETGNSWGLDLSILRATKVVDLGLASHVWMETPDADLATAKSFIETVNNNLKVKGKKASGLYNHSPSFDWDLKFFNDAKYLAISMCDFIKDNHIIPMDQLKTRFYKFIKTIGDDIKGDHRFSNHTADEILLLGLDLHKSIEDITKEKKNLYRKNYRN